MHVKVIVIFIETPTSVAYSLLPFAFPGLSIQARSDASAPFQG